MLEDIANEVHVSKNYLCYIFKKKTGYNFGKYITLLRINRAKKLIKEYKIIGYVSYKCGFSSHVYFSIILKKFKRMSPIEYKNKTDNLINNK